MILGRSEFDKLVSAIRVVLHHLLKWDHQPERRSRSWVITIDEHRDRIVYELNDNPSLRPRIQEATLKAYVSARRQATRGRHVSRPQRFPKRVLMIGKTSPCVQSLKMTTYLGIRQTAPT